MEFIEDELITLSVLIFKKCELEKKLKKTLKCLLRKCFMCLGMASIDEQLRDINNQIQTIQLKKTKILTRTTSI